MAPLRLWHFIQESWLMVRDSLDCAATGKETPAMIKQMIDANRIDGNSIAGDSGQ